MYAGLHAFLALFDQYNGHKETIPFFRPTNLPVLISPNLKSNFFTITRRFHCLQSELWNLQTANALRKAVTWSFALTVPPISSAKRLVCVHSGRLSVFDFRGFHRTPMSLNCTAKLSKRRIRDKNPPNSPTTTAALVHTRSLLGNLSNT